MTNTIQLKFLAGRVSVPSVKWIGTEKARELSLVSHNVVLDAEPDAGAGTCPENEKEASCGQPRWMAVHSYSACVMYWDRPLAEPVRGGGHSCVLPGSTLGCVGADIQA